MGVERRTVVAGAFALAPWLWFGLRDVHSWADGVALGLPVLVAGAVVLLAAVGLLLRRPVLLAVAGAWLLFGLAAVLGPWLPRPTGTPDPSIVVAVANTFGHHTHAPTVAAEILAQEPDLVVGVEATGELREQLLAELSHELVLEPRYEGGATTVVLSRWPIRGRGLDDRRRRAVRGTVDTPAGRLVVYGVHLDKPGIPPLTTSEVGLRTHRRLVDTLVARVEREEAPVILAGDLNLIDRASGYRRLTGVLDDAMRSGWGRHTSLKLATRPLLARIDHIFMPEGWCSAGSRSFTLTSSDHRGVVARVGPCRD